MKQFVTELCIQIKVLEMSIKSYIMLYTFNDETKKF